MPLLTVEPVTGYHQLVKKMSMAAYSDDDCYTNLVDFLADAMHL